MADKSFFQLEIQHLLNKGEKANQTDVHRVLLLGLEEILKKLDRESERIELLSQKVEDLQSLYKELRRYQIEHPSLLYLLRYNTQKTVFQILLVFLVVLVIFGIVDAAILKAMLGIP